MSYSEHTFKPDWYIHPCIERGGQVVTGAGMYDRLANLLGGTLKDGEIHAPLLTKDGFKFASYIGPGTKTYERLLNGDEPVSDVDRVAMAHDIRFTQATTPEEVRIADEKFLKKLEDIEKNKTDNSFNINMGRVPIMSKVLLEDLGIMSKGSFSSMKGISDKKQARLYSDKLKELETLGYGKPRK